MFFTSTLSSFLTKITSSESQNKVTKFPNCLTLLFTTILVLLKLTLNLVIYSTRSQGGSITNSTTSWGAPSSCNLKGESLTSSIETSRTSATFSFTLELGWSSDWGRLPNFNCSSMRVDFHFFANLLGFVGLCGKGGYSRKCHSRWLEVWHCQMWHQFLIVFYLENI